MLCLASVERQSLTQEGHSPALLESAFFSQYKSIGMQKQLKAAQKGHKQLLYCSVLLPENEIYPVINEFCHDTFQTSQLFLLMYIKILKTVPVYCEQNCLYDTEMLCFEWLFTIKRTPKADIGVPLSNMSQKDSGLKCIERLQFITLSLSI